MSQREWQREYKSRYEDCKYEMNLSDILSLSHKIFKRFRKYDSWLDLFGKETVQLFILSRDNKSKRSRDFFANRIAREIFKEFFDQMLTDIIENHDTYSFPNDMVKLSVGFKRNYGSKNYYYNIRTGGKNYTLYVRMGKNFKRYSKKFYSGVFCWKYKQLINKLSDQGYEWNNPKD